MPTPIFLLVTVNAAPGEGEDSGVARAQMIQDELEKLLAVTVERIAAPPLSVGHDPLSSKSLLAYGVDRPTEQTMRVLVALVDLPPDQRSAENVRKAVDDLSSGTVSPTLQRLVAAGLLEEQIIPTPKGKVRKRRFYVLTASGEYFARVLKAHRSASGQA